MLLRYVTPLLGILTAIPQVAAAQALQIPATESVALPRKDVGDGLCATVVHASDPRLDRSRSQVWMMRRHCSIKHRCG